MDAMDAMNITDEIDVITNRKATKNKNLITTESVGFSTSPAKFQPLLTSLDVPLHSSVASPFSQEDEEQERQHLAFLTSNHPVDSSTTTLVPTLTHSPDLPSPPQTTMEDAVLSSSSSSSSTSSTLIYMKSRMIASIADIASAASSCLFFDSSFLCGENPPLCF